MKEFTSVSIIIPALNETYLFRKTVEIMLETCEKIDIEEIVIVLCDRTTIECVETANLIKEEFNTYPINIYYQKKPFFGNALQEAFNLVKGSHVVTAAADMDMDPHAVSKFIKKSKTSPESIIAASRWMPGGGFNGYKKFMLALNYIFQKMIDLLFLTKLTDVTYGYRLYPTELMKSINWEEAKHPFALETCLKPLRLGMNFIEVPATWNLRTEGTSQISFLKYFRYFKTVFHVRFMKKVDIIKK
ncbi:MAG: glycosyltransferase family 2 protein [Eubacteriales bacterium]